jgi:hemolysin III
MKVIDELHAQRVWDQTRGEELANAVSHGLGFIAALVAAPILITTALVSHTSTLLLVGTIVFAATTLLLYFGSTLYHFWPESRVKCALQLIDHSAIFVLIAGTYTPFALGPLKGPWGWTILTLIWCLAGVGVGLKAFSGVSRPRISMGLYLGMGWLILGALRPLIAAVDTGTLFWLFGGGGIYTLGVFFFINDRKPYCHFVWHLFVLAGTACHYCAVFSCVA